FMLARQKAVQPWKMRLGTIHLDINLSANHAVTTIGGWGKAFLGRRRHIPHTKRLASRLEGKRLTTCRDPSVPGSSTSRCGPRTNVRHNIPAHDKLEARVL